MTAARELAQNRSQMARKKKAAVDQNLNVETDASSSSLPPLPSPPETEPAPVDTFSPAECASLWRIVGELEIWVATRIKIPAPIARQIFEYQPEELAMLADPTARVLTKHMSAWVQTRRDELALLMAVVAVHQKKFFFLWRAIQQLRATDKAEAQQERPNENREFAARHEAA